MESKFFEIIESGKLNEIVDRLSNSFTTVVENPKIKKQLFYDTFDWRLHRNNLTLYSEYKTYFLSSLENNLQLNSEIIKKKTLPSFWNDFPDGHLKDKLELHLEMRALIPIINIERDEQVIRILNEDEKTVVRVVLNKIYKINGAVKTIIKNEIQITPVRGYIEKFNKVCEFLINSGIGLKSQNLISTVLEDEKRKTGDYSGKLNIKLTSDMSAAE
ncbi:MAG: hypothetical protein ACRENO_03260, partial [Thermodesulfobacteriota bacterium]